MTRDFSQHKAAAATGVGAKKGMVAAADQQQVAIGHKKVDYKTIPKWHVDSLLREYGLHTTDDLNSKWKFTIGPWAHLSLLSSNHIATLIILAI